MAIRFTVNEPVVGTTPPSRTIYQNVHGALPAIIAVTNQNKAVGQSVHIADDAGTVLYAPSPGYGEIACFSVPSTTKAVIISSAGPLSNLMADVQIIT